MNRFSFYIVPCFILIIVAFGLFKKIQVFDTFLSGAKEGLMSTFSIAPSLIALITSITMLNASGALDIFSSFINPLVSKIGVPSQVVPLMLLRPISGSGSLALLDSIFSSCGPDSQVGRIASVLMGSTETTFYTIAVYFGAINIKKTRHTLHSAVIADLSSYILSCLIIKIMFYS